MDAEQRDTIEAAISIIEELNGNGVWQPKDLVDSTRAVVQRLKDLVAVPLEATDKAWRVEDVRTTCASALEARLNLLEGAGYHPFSVERIPSTICTRIVACNPALISKNRQSAIMGSLGLDPAALAALTALTR